MIFSHWHFCHTLKMQPQDTSDYLEFLFTLEEGDNTSWRVKNEALGWLEKQDAPLLQAYAMPLLAKGMLLLDNPGAGEEDGWEAYQKKCRRIVLRFLETGRSTSWTRSFRKLVQKADENEYNELLDRLLGLPYENPEREYEYSYLESEECAYPILQLSILCAIAEKEPDMVSEAVAEKKPKVIDAALERKWGLLSWKLAMYLRCICGMAFETAEKYFPNQWLGSAECLEIAAYIMLEEQKAKEKSGEDVVRNLLAESFTLEFLEKHKKKIPLESFWIDEKVGDYDQCRICAVLWQNILWNTAFGYDAQACAQQLKGLWNAPFYKKAKRIQIRHLRDCLIPYGAMVTDAEDCPEFYFCTPWQKRTRKKTYRESDGRPFQEFVDISHDASALRMFEAAVLLRRIMGTMEEFPVEYCRILLNMGDVFQCADVVEELSGEGKYWESAVRLLGYFSKNCISMLGRGVLNPNVPQKIVEFLRKGKKTKNPVLNEQYQATGIQVCVHWAVESLRAGIVQREGDIQNPWFFGGTGSCAAQLCRRLFENGADQETFDYNDPILLCRQAFPEEYSQIVSRMDRSPWTVKYEESDGKVGFCDVMLCAEPPVEEWESLGSLKRERFEKRIWLTVLTMRLMSLAKSERMQEHENWYIEWEDAVAAYISESEADGILFYLLVELLAIKFPRTDVHQDYFKRVPLVIGTIHAYTAEDTIFYQYILTERLICEGENAGNRTGARAIGMNLSELYGKRDVKKERELLSYALAWVREKLPVGMLYEIGNVLKIYWEQGCVTKRHHIIVDLERDEWNPLTDFILQRNQEKFGAMRPAQDFSHRYGNRTRNLFKEPAGAESRGKYLGIITNHVDYKKGEKTYEVQYGTGRRERCKDNKIYQKGEVVSVSVEGEGALPKLGKLAWKDDGMPMMAEIMELSAEELKIRLPNREIKFLRESRDKKKFHELLSLWEPDTSRLLCRARRQEGKEEAVEIRYDELLAFYIPVERDFHRLAMEHLYMRGQSGESLRLVFIQELKQDGERYFLFGAEEGVNYRLSETDWEPDSFSRLEEKLEEGNYRQGLIVSACLKEEDGRLVLALAEEEPFQEKNWIWEDFFSEEEFFVIRMERTDGCTSWFVDVNVPDMPGRVTALVPSFFNVAGRTVCNVQLSQDGWDLCNQRHAKVAVELLRAKNLKKEWCTPARFKRLREVVPGDILVLENSRMRKQRDGYHLMMTESNLPVFCAAESLSMESANVAGGMISGRKCVVELVELHAAKTEVEYKVVDIPELAECEGQAEGIVSEFPEELNIPGGNNDKMSLGVWIKSEKNVIPVMVPVSAFESRPKAVGTPVVANRGEDGKWLFCSELRRIQVRALWTLEERKEDRSGRTSGIFLGSDIKVPGYGQCLATQDRERPILCLWEENSIWKMEEGAICGIELGKGKVSKVKRRNVPWDVFPYAKKKDMVRLAADGMEFYGDAAWGEFDEKHKEANWMAEASVYLIKNQDGVLYYDLRRHFSRRNIRLEPVKNAPEKEDGRLDEQYEKWINEGDCHVIGAKLGNGKLMIKDLKVPEEIGKETLRDKWTDVVPMSEDDRPWVCGRYYPNNRVRALLVKKQGAWAASCHEASPFYVNDDLAVEFGVISGDVIRKKLYYAGMDEKNYLRFEWGYGFTFLVSEEDIVDEDGNKIANNLFYGDTIAYFTMLNDGGDFGWKICVEYRAISRQIEGRIWDDSYGGSKLVQILKIRRDLENRKVRVEKVSVTERIIQQEAGLFNSWDFHEVPGAKLEEESIDILLGEEGYEEDTKIIFAKLRPERDSRHTAFMMFTYIPLDGKQGDTWLLEGQNVCLVAGEIEAVGQEGRRQNNRLANDYKISFYLPRELPDKTKNPRMCVNVLRREFSADESRLRTLYSENKAKYLGCKMLVRLTAFNEVKNGRNDWRGNILSTPKRSRDSLKEWVASQEHCLVTLGIENRESLLAEVAPGIVSYLPPNAIQETFGQGTLAALWMEEEELKARIVLAGDQRYLPDSGRPAELLIMDGAAKSYVKLEQESLEPGTYPADQCKRAEEELGKKHFTVAGLPQLLVSDREFLQRKISEEIPRLAYLSMEQKRSREQNAAIQIQEKRLFYAARLRINQDGEPELHYFYPDEKTEKVSWESISFMEGTISELVSFVKGGRWHYHDRRAAFYNREEHRLEAKQLPDGKRYDEIIVFPDGRKKLRYLEKEFLKYGFPAREIIENGIPAKWIVENGVPKKEGVYPVAGVSEDSVWIEVFPGKLLEIPTGYLFSTGKKIPLSGLWTGMFCAGDKICFCQEGGVGENQRKLMLKNAVFGGRPGFGKGNMFYPLKEILKDGVILGGGIWRFTLPAKGAEAWDGQKILRVTKNGKIFRLQDGQALSKGDVLLADCGTKVLSMPGWDFLELRTAYRDLWKNAKWIQEDLLDRDRKRWMREFGFTLPMEINNIERVDGKMLAWVFYRQPNTDPLPDGTIICCICAGVRQGPQGVPEMVVRAGRALLSVPTQNILPGIGKGKIKAVAKALKEERIGFWLHKEEDGWHSGLRKILEKEEFEIRMLSCVEAAGGILCQVVENQALRWLPAENAARVDKMFMDYLWKALSERKDRTAKSLCDGTLSLTGTWQSEQKYELLRTDGTRYRARPMEKVATDEKGIHCYWSELYPKGDLICLYSETEYDCLKKEPVPIEIGKKHEGRVTAHPYGMRRRMLHLTPWVYKALSRASDVDGSGAFDELNLYRFRQEIPGRFVRYREMPGKAEQDYKKAELDYALLRNPERTSEQLVYLYVMISKKMDGKLRMNEVFEFIRLTLKAWIDEQGRFLASGADQEKGGNTVPELDVAPVIAAVLLLDFIKGERGDVRLEQAAKPLSVHLARMLGILCGSSIHQEILLKLWLLGNEEHRGWWLRLNQLSLRGEDLTEHASDVFDGQLTPGQARKLLSICDSLRVHTSGDRNLELVVECIPLSIGILERFDVFYKHLQESFYITQELSVLGRILTPNAGNEIAGSNLNRADIWDLKSLLGRLLRRGAMPLSLVTDTPVPISDMVKKRGLDLCDAFCRILEEGRRGYAAKRGEEKWRKQW